MAESLFVTGLGLEIQTDEGLVKKQYFPVDGIPGNAGLSAEQLALSDNAVVGSEATDNTSGFVYLKKTVGAGEATWVRSATVDDIVATSSSDTWRDPADVKDDSVYGSLAAAETAVNTGALDGVTVAEGDRVLFTSISGENKNVFIVTGTPGAGATLVEDTNAATNNDVLIVDKGTSAGIEFHYNDTTTSWVTSSGTPSNEDGFQNAYTGKPATGSQTTAYTSQVKITNGDSLTVAAGKLDAAVAVNETGIATVTTAQAALQAEVDAVEASLGGIVDASGVYQPHATTNYIDGNADLSEDLSDLDTQIKVNADGIAAIGGGTVSTGITAVTTVDSILVDGVKMVHWLLHIQQGNKIRCFLVEAIHDGTTSADALDTDFTKYARLKLNGNIAGLRVRVSLNGVAAAQTMNLTVQANSAVDVSTTRQQVV